MDSPIGGIASDLESVVAIVVREATEECEPGACLVHSVLDACTRDAVTRLWASEIRAYVPLLALRRVRACIRAGSCATTEW